MILLCKPSFEKLQNRVVQARETSFTYESVGATREDRCPNGFRPHRFQRQIGVGEHDFQLACQSLKMLSPLNQGWISTFPTEIPLEEGALITTVIRTFAAWIVHVGKVIYVLDENGDRPTFSFAYGTLPEYSMRGEERISVTWDRETNSVIYEVYAFVQPLHALAFIGAPYVSHLRTKFFVGGAKEVMKAIKRERAE
jgi:uncharacterized protein (UPF0548 family)